MKIHFIEIERLVVDWMYLDWGTDQYKAVMNTGMNLQVRSGLISHLADGVLHVK
jgi:hypothetical protein